MSGSVTARGRIVIPVTQNALPTKRSLDSWNRNLKNRLSPIQQLLDSTPANKSIKLQHCSKAKRHHYCMNSTNSMESVNSTGPAILLTIDVEDWFQVENFKPYIPFSSWPTYELRVERNVYHILDLLDSINCSTENVPKGTFFVLGWLAERLPHLVREIKVRGHEVASHGYAHRLCKEEPVEELRKDLQKSKKLLEDITGEAVYGYRAPNFSIDHQALKAIEDAGYLYDSSYNSYRLNKRYGHLELFQNHNGVPYKISERFYELPISNLTIGPQVIHWGGGGYFRLIPTKIFVLGVHSILKKDRCYLFYIHPWEFDPAHPRVNGISNYLKFRHYFNLNRTLAKFCVFLNSFKQYSFFTCLDYLKTWVTQQSLQRTQ